MYVLLTEMKPQKDSLTKLQEFLESYYGDYKNVFIKSFEKTSAVKEIPIRLNDLLSKISSDIISYKFLGHVDVFNLTEEQIELFTTPILVDAIGCINLLFFLVVRDLRTDMNDKIVEDVCNAINAGKIEEILGHSMNNISTISRDSDLMRKIDMYLSKIFDAKVPDFIKDNYSMKHYYYNVFQRLAFTYEILDIFSTDVDDVLETKNSIVDHQLIHADLINNSDKMIYFATLIYIQNPNNVSLNLSNLFNNNSHTCYDIVAELRNIGLEVVAVKTGGIPYASYQDLCNRGYNTRKEPNGVTVIQCMPSFHVGSRLDIRRNSSSGSQTKIINPVPSVIKFI